MEEFHLTEDMLAPIADSDRKTDQLAENRVSFRREVFSRLLHNKMAVLGFIVIVIMVLAAIFLPMVYPHGYNDQNLTIANLPYRLHVYVDEDGNQFYYNSEQKVWLIDHNGTFLTPMTKTEEDMMEKQMIFEAEGETVILDYNNKTLTLLDGDGSPFVSEKNVWNKEHPLGTDSLGRDMLIRIIYGARVSLFIALVATLVNLIIGVAYGSIAGYMGGKVDEVMMRIVDIISTIPLMLYVILIMVTIGAGLKSIIIAIGSVFWIDMARIVRGQVMTLKNQEYVMVAKSIGTGPKDIIMRHILPNTIDQILISMVLNIPKAIFTEAFLSYIGLGVPVPLASWGTLCNNAIDVFRIFPYQLVEPSVAICVTMFAFHFLGDGLRDALSNKTVQI